VQEVAQGDQVQEQGTRGNEKKEQLAKEYKEKVDEKLRDI